MLRKNIIEEIINFQLWEENLRHWSLYQWREMVKGFSSPFYLGDLRFVFISTGSIHSDRIHRLRVPLWFAPAPFLEIITFLHRKKRYKNTNSNSDRVLFYFYLFCAQRKNISILAPLHFLSKYEKCCSYWCLRFYFEKENIDTKSACLFVSVFWQQSNFGV